ncbi:MAG: hypothetical protein J3K34DRAFT_60650 [Monoraphidium minutum]|nr:MAG: hypothetical protein J3K34DRAFT_60650 [Monoraphidium minutum]
MDAAGMDAMMSQQLQELVGQRFVVMHLSSARGAGLNGRRCVATARDDRRVAVRMLDDGAAFSLRMANLAPEAQASAYTPPHGPGVPEPELRERLAAAAAFHARAHCPPKVTDRDDVRARIAYVNRHLAGGAAPPPPRCGDMLLPAGAPLNPLLVMLTAVQPCCLGDGTVDFRRFNTGLVGSGGECCVCMEALPASEAAVGFPCGHAFHTACATPWLRNNNTCPACRFKLAMPGEEYAFIMRDHEERLTSRLREWFVSGFCERCQAHYMETDPLLAIPDPDGGPTVLVPRSHLG